MQRHIHRRQPVIAAQLVHLHHVDKAFHLGLHAFKADIPAQLVKQIIQLLRRPLLFRLRGRLRGSRGLRRRGGLLRISGGRGLVPQIVGNRPRAVFAQPANDLQLLFQHLVAHVRRGGLVRLLRLFLQRADRAPYVVRHAAKIALGYFPDFFHLSFDRAILLVHVPPPALCFLLADYNTNRARSYTVFFAREESFPERTCVRPICAL